ncbi:hypothetical protein [Pelomonas sp. KK5]|uniref:hypothetical protein n=1 Tax=Pelomonas sp. KK5 TaxID=1855730 RepID=UPI00097C3D3F|nr:hypothetical protein [Pelomonas sp. KK5]
MKKTLRICFLLLLAVLLPLRGAVAAAMLCPVGSAGMQSELRVAPEHAGHDHGSHHESASDKCNMCSAFCSITPLVGPTITLPEPIEPAVLEFPELSAPPPDFFSDGQERPPRSF